MKNILTSIVFVFGLSALANAQESPSYIVAYFDVAEAGDTIRYYTQIIPLPPSSDMECVEDKVFSSFVASTGIEKVVFWKIYGAASLEEADKMVIEKMTVPGRKKAWFKGEGACE